MNSRERELIALAKLNLTQAATYADHAVDNLAEMGPRHEAHERLIMLARSALSKLETACDRIDYIECEVQHKEVAE